SSGDLPGGISLSQDGELFGIPNQTGTFNFIIQVKDLINDTSTREFNLTVNS
ncbi:MAG: putative Ig domain-containing protein, partial [Candidatus Aenigmarchaeota archaeon]|nr:putative Ig domain-containing protein [Candidatus Aenigmarchaeota archaeon]